MTKTAFLVEGILEQRFIQKICKGVTVRTIGCNGDDVELAALAKRIGTQIRLLQSSHNIIVVIFDREGRKLTCDEIRAQMLTLLAQEKITAQLILGIPDREIENWILADLERLTESAKLQPQIPLESFEGTGGKAKLKRMLGSQHYIETVHGVEWLKKARPAVIAENSSSFSFLQNALAKLDCWWLSRTELV